MSSNTYWRDRELEWKKERLKDEQEYADEIQEIYANMMDSVEKEIESFFSRYANKENITMAEAKKRVSSIDIEAYKRKAKKYVKEKNFSDEANEQMRLYNLAMKVNRLELLKANIGLELVAGHDELKSYTGQKLEGAYLEEIKRNASILGDTVIDNAKMAKTVADSSFKNATFSERIWVNQDQLKNNLSSVLSSALIQGKNPREFIPQIRKKFDVSRCNAERLLRTEIARVQTQAQAESYEANGIDEYEYIACSLKDVCPLCKEMDGKVFKLKDMEIGENAPPLHPNCHCATAPHSDRKEYEKWLDGLANGEHSLRFDEWKEQKEFTKNELVQNSYARLEKSAYKSCIASGFSKFIAYKAKGTKNNLYVSERVDITNKKIRRFDACYSRALKLISANNENVPNIVIVDCTELKSNSIGSYDGRTNNLYIYKGLAIYDSKKINNPKKMMNEENALLTIVHELNHWKDSLEYEKTHGKITEDNYLDYLNNCDTKGYKLFENKLSKGYDISEVSEYAKRSLKKKNYDEIRTEYNTYKSIGGKDNDLSRNGKEKK